MEIIKTPIDGLIIIKPNVFNDERGSFFESWSYDSFRDIGLSLKFVQDNQSISKKGVLRGLHFQNPPYEQGKLVRVIKGSVLDVAVDIRKKSATYGKYFSIELSDKNNLFLWIPPGFAHGFVSLEENTIFHYKCTGLYNSESEGSILWNDSDIAINWKCDNPIISQKDMNAKNFNDLVSQF